MQEIKDINENENLSSTNNEISTINALVKINKNVDDYRNEKEKGNYYDNFDDVEGFEEDYEYGAKFGFGNIDEDDEIDLLIDRLFKYIKKGEFDNAEILYNELQSSNIKNYKIYLAKVMLDMGVSRIDMLGDCLELYDYANTNINFKRCYRLSDNEFRDILKSYVHNSYLKNIYQNAEYIYEKAVKDFDKQLLKEAQDNFSELGEYKDAKNMYEECSILLTEWEDKDNAYERLLNNKNQWIKASIDDLTKDKNQLIELKNYRESNNLLELITTILELKEKEKADFIKRMNNEKILFIFLSFTFVTLIIVMVKFDLCDIVAPILALNFMGIIVTGIHLILRWFVGLVKNYISIFTKK